MYRPLGKSPAHLYSTSKPQRVRKTKRKQQFARCNSFHSPIQVAIFSVFPLLSPLFFLLKLRVYKYSIYMSGAIRLAVTGTRVSSTNCIWRPSIWFFSFSSPRTAETLACSIESLNPRAGKESAHLFAIFQMELCAEFIENYTQLNWMAEWQKTLKCRVPFESRIVCVWQSFWALKAKSWPRAFVFHTRARLKYNPWGGAWLCH